MFSMVFPEDCDSREKESIAVLLTRFSCDVVSGLLKM
jgi:hypothetical protein